MQEDMKCAMLENNLRKYVVQSKKEVHFVKDEAQALEAISSFKIDLMSSKRSLDYYEKLYQDCSLIEGKKLNGCPYHVDTYLFFEELLQAVKTYKWKPETNQKAIALTAAYARFQLKEPQNLNSVWYLAKIFEQLALNGFLKKDISSEIKKVVSEISGLRQKQWEGLRKTGIKDCDKALENFYEEVESGEKYVKIMRAWDEALP